jgi:chorismate mutase
MPITENNFTGDELRAAITANKDVLLPIVRGVLSTDLKMTVQDEAEHNTFKQNYENEIVGRKTGEWAQLLEKDVKELTGIDKTGNDEKYYDYFKRATSTALAERNTLKTELATLKSQHNPTAADKARIEQLEQGLATKETEFGTEKQKLQSKIHELTVGNNLAGGLAKIRSLYKKDIDPSIIETVERVAVQDLTKMAEVQADGKLIYKGEDGKVLTDQVLYQPLTGEQLLMERLKGLIDAGRQQQGAGGAAGGAAGAAGDGGAPEGAQPITALPAEVTTKLKLTEYMQKMGWTTSNPEWNKTFDKLGAKLPLK